MSNYIPNKAEHSFEETSDIVNTIGNLFQKATNGEPFNYSITDMGYTKHDEAAAIVDEEFKKSEKGEVLEAPEATKEGDELVDKMLEDAHGVTVERPSYFFDGATVTQSESTLTDKKPEAPTFNEYGEIVRGEDQPEVNDNTIPTFTPPEPEEVIDPRSYVSNGGVFADKQPKEQEIIESQVSTSGDYNDIVSSAVNQGKETEKSYFFDNEQPSEENVTEEPAKEVGDAKEEEESADKEEEYHNGANQISDAELNAAMAALRADRSEGEKPVDTSSQNDGDADKNGGVEEDGGMTR